MAYASPEQLISRYREALEVLVPGEQEGTIDEAALAQPLVDASNEIDAYLAARYPLPLDETPGVLVRIAADIAIYRLSSEADSLTEERRTRYEDAVKLLKAISRGEASLGLPDPDPSPSTEGASITQSDRVFSRESLRGY